MCVNTSFPAPQADRIDKVAVVVDAVCAGADTASAIAAALEMVERQGYYYANAAGYLGLISVVAGTTPVEYALTTEGAHYLGSGPGARAALLTELIATVPAVQIYLDSDLAAVQLHYMDDGLDEVTATRRAHTALGWAQAATAGTIDADEIAASTSAARAAAPAIAAALAAQRLAAKPVEPAICGGCFLQLPATGVCGNC